MRILVTGRLGQIAVALSQVRLDDGMDLVLVGRPEFELTSETSIRECIRAVAPDVVVNAAAYTGVDLAESEVGLAHRINGWAAGVVADAAASQGAAVLQLSTDYVFDGLKSTPYVEDDPVSPQNVYGHSKLAGERAVAAANPRHVIVRTSWVYAPFGANFVRTMLQLASSKDEIQVVDDQIGSPTYAPDLADALIGIARRVGDRARSVPADHWGTFHIAGAGETSWAGMAERVFAGSAARGGPCSRVRRIESTDYPTAAARPANSRLDCRRLQEVYGLLLPEWRDSLELCLDAMPPGDAA